MLVLLGMATALVSIAACALAQDQAFATAGRILLLALVFGQTSLLALFLGLGTAHWLLRLIALTAGIAVWVAALGHTIHAPHGYTATFLALQAATVAVLAAGQRQAGMGWFTTVPAGDSAPAGTGNGRQFTLAQLLGLITLVAMLAALGHWTLFPAATAGVRQAAVLTINVLVGWAAAWTASTADHGLPRSVILVAAAAGLGMALNALVPSSHGRGADVALFVLQALFMAAWIGAGRGAGLRSDQDYAS